MTNRNEKVAKAHRTGQIRWIEKGNSKRKKEKDLLKATS
jgi:hypothetical protein